MGRCHDPGLLGQGRTLRSTSSFLFFDLWLLSVPHSEIFSGNYLWITNAHVPCFCRFSFLTVCWSGSGGSFFNDFAWHWVTYSCLWLAWRRAWNSITLHGCPEADTDPAQSSNLRLSLEVPRPSSEVLRLSWEYIGYIIYKITEDPLQLGGPSREAAGEISTLENPSTGKAELPSQSNLFGWTQWRVR